MSEFGILISVFSLLLFVVVLKVFLRMWNLFNENEEEYEWHNKEWADAEYYRYPEHYED